MTMASDTSLLRVIFLFALVLFSKEAKAFCSLLSARYDRVSSKAATSIASDTLTNDDVKSSVAVMREKMTT